MVVDTNIAFCALAAGCGDLGIRLMSPSDVTFYAPRFLFVELFKHKDRIIRASKIPVESIFNALNELMESVQLIESASIPIGT